MCVSIHARNEDAQRLLMDKIYQNQPEFSLGLRSINYGYFSQLDRTLSFYKQLNPSQGLAFQYQNQNLNDTLSVNSNQVDLNLFTIHHSMLINSWILLNQIEWSTRNTLSIHPLLEWSKNPYFIYVGYHYFSRDQTTPDIFYRNLTLHEAYAGAEYQFQKIWHPSVAIGTSIYPNQKSYNRNSLELGLQLDLLGPKFLHEGYFHNPEHYFLFGYQKYLGMRFTALAEWSEPDILYQIQRAALLLQWPINSLLYLRSSFGFGLQAHKLDFYSQNQGELELFLTTKRELALSIKSDWIRNSNQSAANPDYISHTGFSVNGYWKW